MSTIPVFVSHLDPLLILIELNADLEDLAQKATSCL